MNGDAEPEDPFRTSSKSPSLYGRMMRAIRTGHSVGNAVRMLKLPLIFTEANLYAGAIGQFWALSRALEEALKKHKADEMVAHVLSMGLHVTPGYEADLREILGPAWKQRLVLTASTEEYVEVLHRSTPVSLVSASFILYGALVVGGGRSTQIKVRGVFPECEHKLFDVAADMKVARKKFKETYDRIGREFPEHFDSIVDTAAEFMGRNNSVVFSLSCVGNRVMAWCAAIGVGLIGIGVVAKAFPQR